MNEYSFSIKTDTPLSRKIKPQYAILKFKQLKYLKIISKYNDKSEAFRKEKRIIRTFRRMNGYSLRGRYRFIFGGLITERSYGDESTGEHHLIHSQTANN